MDLSLQDTSSENSTDRRAAGCWKFAVVLLCLRKLTETEISAEPTLVSSTETSVENLKHMQMAERKVLGYFSVKKAIALTSSMKRITDSNVWKQAISDGEKINYNTIIKADLVPPVCSQL